MPVADAVDRKSEFSKQANSSLVCIRARDPNFSIDVPSLPPGEPWATGDRGNGDLSAGAKAGIAVAAVVVALFLAGCTSWLYRRKRSRLSKSLQQSTSNSAEPDHWAGASLSNEQKTMVEADVVSHAGGTPAPSRNHKVQPGGIPMAELNGDREPAELGYVKDSVGGE